jgi:release factor glutamine methyltransferase
MPTIQTAIQKADRELQPRKIVCVGERDLGHLEAEILLAHILKKDRVFLHAHPDYSLQTTCLAGRQAHYKLFQQLIKRRKKHEPIAYIIGSKEFYSLPFFVNRHVLIPRPESELLVELALQAKPDLVWDVGTGSGAIAISIAKKIQPQPVLATDLSSSALTVARKNIKLHQAKNITLLKADLLSQTVLRYFKCRHLKKLIITANLPYLPKTDKPLLDPDVIKYEPTNALFGGTSGLEVIKKFLTQISQAKLKFAHIFLEIDPRQTKKLRAIAKSLFPKAELQIHKDLAKRDRVFELQN